MIKRPPPATACGFSLSELLVALALITILLALALPGYRRINAANRGIKCLANLRNYGTAALVYTAENQGIPRWDGLSSSQATEGSTYPDWELWVRPYLHLRRDDRLRCPNLPENLRTAHAYRNTFNYGGNTALAIYYPKLNDVPVPSSRIVLAAETYGHGFNHAVHFNMTMWGLNESSAEGPNTGYSTHESDKAQFHGSPKHRTLNLFFLDGHAAPIAVPPGKDWRVAPLYGSTSAASDDGYFYDRRQFRTLYQNSR